MYITTLRGTHRDGQVIVLVAMLMVVLIAVLGLAIDGGGMFLLYRDVQNATDAAALSSAFTLCTGGNSSSVQSAGENSAGMNNFVDGVDGATVRIENPPLSGEFAGKSDYVLIHIEVVKPSYFIQVVYPGPLTVSSTTISRCNPGFQSDWPDRSAIITLSRGCAAGNGNTAPQRNTGGSTFRTVSGGIYINSSNCGNGGSRATGGSSIVAGSYGICTQGTGIVNTGGSTTVASDGGTLSTRCPTPQIMQDDPLVDSGSLTPLNCSNFTFRGTLQPGTNQPGTYDVFDTNGSTPYVLEPGIYCITDNDISWKGILRNYPDAGGVFLFFDGTLRVTSNGGNPDQDLHAMQDRNSDYKGLLMWFHDPDEPPTNRTALNFTAQTSGAFTGTIYAPRKHCNLSGGSAGMIYGQFICYSFDNNGSASTTVVYLPSILFDLPASFGIVQ